MCVSIGLQLHANAAALYKDENLINFSVFVFHNVLAADLIQPSQMR